MNTIRWTFTLIVGCLISLSHTLAQPTWLKMGDLNSPRFRFGAAYLGNGEILVAGGFASTNGTGKGFICTASCEIVNVNTKKISMSAPMNYPRAEYPLLHTKDSNIVAVSGVLNDAFSSGGVNMNTSTVEIFDRKERQWKILGNLITGRRQHAACFINDDEILVVGGREDNVNTLNTAEIFNIKSGKSRRVADYPYFRNEIVLGVLSSGKIIACGGREGGANSSRNNEVYSYEINSNVWRLQNDTIYSGANGARMMKMWDGRLILCGGSITDKPPVNTEKSVFVERANALRYLTLMAEGRSAHSIAQLNETNVIATGGWKNSYDLSEATVTKIDVERGVSIVLPPMHESRVYHQLISVPTQFSAAGTPTKAQIVAISGVKSTILDGSANFLGYTFCSGVEILEDCKTQPQISIIGAKTLCPGEYTRLCLNKPYSKISWSSGANTDTLIVNKTGVYSVNVIDEYGCNGNATIEVNSTPYIIQVVSTTHDRIQQSDKTIRHNVKIVLENKGTKQVRLTIADLRFLSGIASAINIEGIPSEIAAGASHNLYLSFTTPDNADSFDTLAISLANQCLLTVPIVLKGVTSVDEYSEIAHKEFLLGNTIKIQPSPVNGNQCELHIRTDEQEVELSFYDALGVMVYNRTQAVRDGYCIIPTQTLSNGVYMALIKGKRFTASTLCLVQK